MQHTTIGTTVAVCAHISLNRGRGYLLVWLTLPGGFPSPRFRRDWGVTLAHPVPHSSFALASVGMLGATGTPCTLSDKAMLPPPVGLGPPISLVFTCANLNASIGSILFVMLFLSYSSSFPISTERDVRPPATSRQRYPIPFYFPLTIKTILTEGGTCRHLPRVWELGIALLRSCLN